MEIAREKQREMLRSMLLARRFDEALADICAGPENNVPGMMITSMWEEAVGSGVCAALQPQDVIITNHRSHNHLLAKGADPRGLMAEIYGKATGCNKGKSGTLHMAVPEVNAPCTSTVVGASLPIAVGAAFAQKYKKEQAITVCFFGDGASDEGSFHEALNLASLWALPVLFVCQNNLYAGAQRYEEHTRVRDIADRAAAYAMRASIVDGNDAPAVYMAALAERERLLAGDGPALLECKTYRCRGHSETDAHQYQPKDEIAAWMAKCPIPRLRAAMLDQGVITPDELAAMDDEVKAVVADAVRFAEESPYPAPEEALEDVYVP